MDILQIIGAIGSIVTIGGGVLAYAKNWKIVTKLLANFLTNVSVPLIFHDED